jgi:uncharacterized membrane protein YtjA (UPF0391 family)
MINNPSEKEWIMLNWALAFLVLALVAALFGFTGIAGASVGIAKVLFFVFLALLIISLFVGGLRTTPAP